MSVGRRQWIALTLSGIFPGLGQLYLGRWVTGAAFLSAASVLSWLLGRSASPGDLLTGRLPDPLASLGIVAALLLVALWSAWDAWHADRGSDSIEGVREFRE